MSRCGTAGDVETLVATEYRGGVDLTVQDTRPDGVPETQSWRRNPDMYEGKPLTSKDNPS